MKYLKHNNHIIQVGHEQGGTACLKVENNHIK